MRKIIYSLHCAIERMTNGTIDDKEALEKKMNNITSANYYYY